jgi:hypothetical protein
MLENVKKNLPKQPYLRYITPASIVSALWRNPFPPNWPANMASNKEGECLAQVVGNKMGHGS